MSRRSTRYTNNNVDEANVAPARSNHTNSGFASVGSSLTSPHMNSSIDNVLTHQNSMSSNEVNARSLDPINWNITPDVTIIISVS